MCWRAVLVIPKRHRPHPRRSYGRRGGVENAAYDRAIGEHVEVVVTPLAGRTRGRGAPEINWVTAYSFVATIVRAATTKAATKDNAC